MGRQKVHVTLPSGEKVWITGATFSDLIQNALDKYGAPQNPVIVSSLTFKEYTDDIWDVFLKPRWRASTAETNKHLLDKHILPYFGQFSMSDINVAAVQKFFQAKQHLSKSYAKQMLILLHEIFDNAVEDGVTADDPTLSKRIVLPQKATERDALEPTQFYDVISHLCVLETEEAKLMALLCFTGMRRGEILGLKWDNVKENRVLVRAEVTFKGNKPVYSDYTKSAAGIRNIPIPRELSPYLADRGSGFVLGGDTPYTQSKFDRTWQRIGKKMNLYNATPHIFRHTYLSLLAASNVDPKTIQALAGHADFSFTFNKYISRNKANMQSASDKFSNHIEELTQKLTKHDPVDSNNFNGYSNLLSTQS